MSKISEIVESKKHYDGITLVERMKECHTSAVSIAIIENYEICEAYGYGVKRRATKEKVTADTLFQAGSIRYGRRFRPKSRMQTQAGFLFTFMIVPRV